MTLASAAGSVDADDVMRPLRIAILGGGAVTSDLYLSALDLVDHVDVATIVEPSEASVARLRDAGYRGLVDLTGFEQFLAATERHKKLALDAIVVALPVALHEAAVTQALERGLHVLCEKPLALTAAACERMAATADQTGKVLAVGMTRRLPANITALRESLRAGLAGTIARVDIEDGGPYAWTADSGAAFRSESGGVVADIGVHYLDLLHDLFGPLTPVRYEDDWRGGCEATAEFTLLGRGDLPIRLKLSREHQLRNTSIYEGDRGRLTLDKNDFATCRWTPAEPVSLEAVIRPTRPFVGEHWPSSFESAFAQQFWEFAETVRGRRRSRVTARDAGAVVGLIEWAYERRATLARTHASDAAGVQRAQSRLAGARVVVTGGTGFIGSRLVERLLDDDAGPLVVPVRNYRSCAPVARFPVIMPRVDLFDRKSVDDAVAGAKFVFHLAYGRDGKDAAHVTIDGTRIVVEAAIAAGAECVVVLSTTDVFGRSVAPETLNESAPYRPQGDYGSAKVQMERWCLERARTAGRTRLVVLNPGIVYGIGGKTFTTMPISMARGGTWCWVDGGVGLANYIYVDNLTDAILKAATTPEAHGQHLILVDGACTWRQLMEPFLGTLAASQPSFSAEELRAMERGHPRARISDVLRAAARSPELVRSLSDLPMIGKAKTIVLDRYPALRTRLKGDGDRGRAPTQRSETSKESAEPPAWLATLFGPTRTIFTNERARHVLGWEPHISLHDGHARTVAWLREIGLLPES